MLKLDMKRNWKYGRFICLLATVLLVASCKNNSGEHSKHRNKEAEQSDVPAAHDHQSATNAESPSVYTCPMHPEIIRNEPGSCPICGMDLVEKETTAAVSDTVPIDFKLMLKPTYEYVLSNVKTCRPEHKALIADIEVPGYLTYDARKVQSVSARYAGRIERLYIRYPFQYVKRGQKVLDIYSAEIVTAQQDLIFLLENDPTNTSLIDNARHRLSLLGMTPDQISMVEKNKKSMLSLPVFSPYAGIVIEKQTLFQPAKEGDMSDKMGDNEILPKTQVPSGGEGELSIREGMYLQKGQNLFDLQSTSTVWAILEFYLNDAESIRSGQSVTIRIESYENDFKGKIDYIEPLVGSDRKNLRARVYLENQGNKLKPGTLLKAVVNTGKRDGLWIPASAALDLGKEKVVFVKKDGVFQIRKISSGVRTSDWLEIKSGITSSDEIAANAQFLMDSESFIKSN